MKNKSNDFKLWKNTSRSQTFLTAHLQTRHYIPVLSFGQEGESVGMLNGPWGVAVNDRDQIALTEPPGLSSSTTGFQCLEVTVPT